MKVCIIGDGLVSLLLAKVMALKAISVDVFSSGKLKKYSETRTIGITKSNVDYINKNIINIKKILWEIKKIKIFSENYNKNEILNFSNFNNQAFSVVKNYELYKIVRKSLHNDKFVRFQNRKDLAKIIDKKNNIIIKWDLNKNITKKYYSNKIQKKYNSYAYTTLISHKR